MRAILSLLFLVGLISTPAYSYDLSIVKDEYSTEMREQRPVNKYVKAGIGLTYFSHEGATGGGAGVFLAPRVVKLWRFTLDLPLGITGVAMSFPETVPNTPSFGAGLFYDAMANLQFRLWHFHVGGMYGYRWTHDATYVDFQRDYLEGDLARVYAGLSF